MDVVSDPRTPTADRVGELTDRLAAVRERVAEACRAAGRDPSEVGLLAVTKTIPAVGRDGR
jgi:hypothetical protein